MTIATLEEGDRGSKRGGGEQERKKLQILMTQSVNWGVMKPI